jgi:hypothetical protein
MGMKWASKRDSDGQVVRDCWVTDSGYTVAECRLPEARYPITRPRETLPFAYAKDRTEVVGIIKRDQAKT